MNESKSPKRTALGEPLKKHPGLSSIDLQQPSPWGMGLVGLVKWLVWTPEVIVGKRKTAHIEKILEVALQELDIKEQELTPLVKAFYNVYNEELEEAKASEPYENYRSQRYLHPVEATRRIRYFSEDFLNKEFDIFCSLLPSPMLSSYLQTHFGIDKRGEWHTFGNSNDLEFSMHMLFMQIDTLAYNPEQNLLVGLELKIDADLGKKQVMKYCMMVAYLESTGKLPPGTQFKLLVIGASPTTTDEHQATLENANQVLQDKDYPKRGLVAGQAASLHERTEELLSSLELSFTTWQEFGDYFANVRAQMIGTGNEESCYKLLDGFLVTLNEKYSRKQKQLLYIPQPSDEQAETIQKQAEPQQKDGTQVTPSSSESSSSKSSMMLGFVAGSVTTMILYVLYSLLTLK